MEKYSKVVQQNKKTAQPITLTQGHNFKNIKRI